MSGESNPYVTHTIKTLGELLQELVQREKKTIKEFEAEGFSVTHGPTIGDIYEGLTDKLLNHALPINLNLRITNGFIIGKNQKKSGQIDCMLVKGKGTQIPNTNHEIVRVDDVLAVFEVKKTLYGNAIPDVLDHFNQLLLLDRESTDGIDAESIFRVFSQITGASISGFSEANSLPFHQKAIFHSLVSEHTHPVRIAISYDGFKTESGFRKSFVGLMTENIGQSWIPPTGWPELVISGEYSMVKMNGRPFLTPSRNSAWQIYGTTRVNPIQLILEVLYTQISLEHSSIEFWGEDLENECISRFLEAEAVEQDGKMGWKWEHIEFNEQQLKEEGATAPWTPFFADKEEAIALILLCQSPDGLEISEIVKGIGDRAEDLVERLKRSGLVAQRGSKIVLTTVQAKGGFLPDGRYFFGEDNTGRLTRWAMSQIKKGTED